MSLLPNIAVSARAVFGRATPARVAAALSTCVLGTALLLSGCQAPRADFAMHGTTHPAPPSVAVAQVLPDGTTRSLPTAADPPANDQVGRLGAAGPRGQSLGGDAAPAERNETMQAGMPANVNSTSSAIQQTAGARAAVPDPRPDGTVELLGIEQCVPTISGPREPEEWLHKPFAGCDAGCGYHLGTDLKRFGCMMRSDTEALINWDNALVLGVAAGGAIALRQDTDAEVRRHVTRHPERWGEGSKALGKLGDLPVQVPTILSVYSYGVWTGDERLQQFGETLISAYTINGVSTVLIKAAANTDRPSDEWNGGQFGFPSFHTSSSFTLASVIDEYYGPGAGLPAYALAGMIGWSRIDERDHDLSDVFFGAALGYVVGKSVARHHLYGDGRVRLLPYVHPSDGTTGVMFETTY